MSQKSIVVERINRTPLEKQPIEIVERKGLGHPDYIADAIAEEASRALCRYYLETYGDILHHNVDKVLVVGGQAAPKFGGGVVLKPIYILVAGRATTHIKTASGEEPVPIGPIILGAAREWLRKNFRYLDVDRHVIIDYRIGHGSADLVELYERGRKSKYPGANDTSLGVGYAPLTETERLVLETERYLNSAQLKRELPAVGEDIKVMAVRRGDIIDLTIAAAIVSREVKDIDEYVSIKEEIAERVLKIADSITNREVKVYVNTADKIELGDEGGVYLVVTGTSAEHGDDGATGRGNRVNGLITPMRPMSMEAAAGKNPVSHVGKVYNVLANRIAKRIAENDNVQEVYVELLSQIGKPINQPLIAYIGLVVEDGVSINELRYEATSIAEEELDAITDLKTLIVEGKVDLF